MKTFDKAKDNSSFIYLDKNNLYGKATCEKLLIDLNVMNDVQPRTKYFRQILEIVRCFSMECFAAAFFQFCCITVKICFLSGWLSTCPSIPTISGISLRFPYFLKD